MMLPQELIDCIMGFMDFTSLKQSACVSHLWMVSTRRRLFRRVRLHIYQTPDRNRELSEFKATFGRMPAFGLYLHHLYISGLVHFPVFIDVLALLIQLRTLVLGGTNIIDFPREVALPPQLYRNIESITFSYIDFEGRPDAWLPKLYIASMFSTVSEIVSIGPCLLPPGSRLNPCYKNHATDRDYAFKSQFSNIASMPIRLRDGDLGLPYLSQLCIDILTHYFDPSTGTLTIHAWPFLSCSEFPNFAPHCERFASQKLSSNSFHTIQFVLNSSETEGHTWINAINVLAMCQWHQPPLKRAVFKVMGHAGPPFITSVERGKSLSPLLKLQEVIIDVMAEPHHWVNVQKALRGLIPNTRCSVVLCHNGEVFRSKWRVRSYLHATWLFCSPWLLH